MLLPDPPQRLLDLPVQQHVLEGLVPPLGQLAAGSRPRRPRTAQVDHDVAEDREQPGAQRAELGVEAICGPPGSQEGLLHRLLAQPGIL
jgi:hypothetical protein